MTTATQHPTPDTRHPNDSARNEKPTILSGRFEALPLEAVQPSPLNPRKRIDDAELRELAESIRAQGLIEPIVVRPMSGDDIRSIPDHPSQYWIICGERRWRAAKLAGLVNIQARILNGIDDRTALEMALVENLQRKDIDPIEEAQGYAKLIELGHKQKDIAEKVNRSQEAISNAIRLLKLPEEVQEKISAGELSPSHGKALVSYVDTPALFKAQAERALSGATSKDIETFTWHAAWKLIDRNLARRMDQHRSFDPKIECKGCNTRRRADNIPICLNPACFDKKAAAGRAKQIEEARKAAGLAADAELLRVQDLKYGDYSLFNGHYPSGCRTDCKHRTMALNSSGNPEPICLDSTCHRKLKAQDMKAKNKDVRAGLNNTLERAVGQISSGQADNICVVLACWSAIRNAKKDCIRAAIAHLNVQFTDAQLQPSYGGPSGEQCRANLLSLGPDMLIRLAAQIKLREEIRQCGEYTSMKPEFTEWFIAQCDKQLVEKAEVSRTKSDRDRPVICTARHTKYGEVAVLSLSEERQTAYVLPNGYTYGTNVKLSELTMPTLDTPPPVTDSKHDCIRRCSICTSRCGNGAGSYPDDYPADNPDSPAWLKIGATAQWIAPGGQSHTVEIIGLAGKYLTVQIPDKPGSSGRLTPAKPAELWPWRENAPEPPVPDPRSLAPIELRARVLGAASNPSGNEACDVCGCTEDRACPEGCAWWSQNLCDACVYKAFSHEDFPEQVIKARSFYRLNTPDPSPGPQPPTPCSDCVADLEECHLPDDGNCPNYKAPEAE